MTREQFIEFAKKRYGHNWIQPLAHEIGCNHSTMWRIAKGEINVISRRMELEIERLKPLRER